MSRTLGKPVLIENITGAGGLIGLQRFLKSPPDGYTLFTGSISSHGINPVLTKNLLWCLNLSYQLVNIKRLDRYWMTASTGLTRSRIRRKKLRDYSASIFSHSLRQARVRPLSAPSF